MFSGICIGIRIDQYGGCGGLSTRMVLFLVWSLLSIGVQ